MTTSNSIKVKAQNGFAAPIEVGFICFQRFSAWIRQLQNLKRLLGDFESASGLCQAFSAIRWEIQASDSKLNQRLAKLELEINNFVNALGKGKISVARLEKEMERREADKKAPGERLNVLNQRINEESAGDFNSELVVKICSDFGIYPTS